MSKTRLRRRSSAQTTTRFLLLQAIFGVNDLPPLSTEVEGWLHVLPPSSEEATRSCLLRGWSRHHRYTIASSPDGPTARSAFRALTPFSDGRISTSFSHASWGFALASRTAPPPVRRSPSRCQRRRTSSSGPAQAP